MRYFVEDNGPISPGKPHWKVVDRNGETIAYIQGGSSAIVALAACERLNENKTLWSFYGWTQRLMDNMFKKN